MRLDVLICVSKNPKLINNLLKALFQTDIDFDLYVIREKEFREKTLNYGMRLVGNRDLLILGDDIILTPNWDKKLKQWANKADIIGFSMLYPNTSKIQDTGYDLVKIDDQVTLMPQNRGKRKKTIKPFGFRECDAICGCAMFIKKAVLKKLNDFSLDGQNRYGEFIYTYQAKRHGFKTIVLDHYLYHHGTSTKSNDNINYRSISWQYEKKLWEKIVAKYINKKRMKINYQTRLSDKLKKFLGNANSLLIYGVGTITTRIIQELKPNKLAFCTGLPEEVGLKFFNYLVYDYKEINYKKFKTIIITTLANSSKIHNLLKPYLIQQHEIYKIISSVNKGCIEYNIKKI